MGWASGGAIFDTVAGALVKTDIGTDDAVRVLYTLARSLMDGDWDTVDESIGEFRAHPVVVLALRMAMDRTHLEDADGRHSGHLEFRPGRDGPVCWDAQFALVQDGYADEIRAATQRGWNELVALWLQRQDGNVESWLAGSLPI